MLARQSDFRGTDRREPNELSTLMLQSVERAVKSWKFRQRDTDNFQLAFDFRLVDSDNELNQPVYTVYRVEENPMRPPTKVTIEYHFPAISK